MRDAQIHRERVAEELSRGAGADHRAQAEGRVEPRVYRDLGVVSLGAGAIAVIESELEARASGGRAVLRAGGSHERERGEHARDGEDDTNQGDLLV